MQAVAGTSGTSITKEEEELGSLEQNLSPFSSSPFLGVNPMTFWWRWPKRCFERDVLTRDFAAALSSLS